MNDPLPTITKGIALAATRPPGSRRVLVCNGTYSEQVVIDADHDGVSVYGSFDCVNGWQSTAFTSGQSATVNWTQPLYALRVNGITQPIEIADISFTVADGVGQDDAGAGLSSIVAFISEEDAGVTLTRVTLAAGSGASGANGAIAPSNWSAAELAEGSAALQGSIITSVGEGAPSKTCPCAVWGSSQGGAGGNAGDPAEAGTSGTSTPPVDDGGFGGLGGQGYAGDAGACTAGGDGANAENQTDGGVGAQVVGTVTSEGWTPAAGTDGQPGNPGQGGGGGGGYDDLITYGCAGTGGGCGGCGGAGGLAGQGGGSSIGILAYHATLNAQSVTISTAGAGNGGAGGIGESGDVGGEPGVYENVKCLGVRGGKGGAGAGGQGGGGGAGGISAAVVESDSSVVLLDSPAIAWKAGTGALGGAGGNGGGSGTQDAGGQAGTSGGTGIDGTSTTEIVSL